VGAMCLGKTNDDHRFAHVHLLDGHAGVCVENTDMVWDSPWKSKNAITLPSAAEPGMWLVTLKVHE